MKTSEDIESIEGVRFYLSPDRLLALESPVLSGLALRLAISPRLTMTARSYRRLDANREQLVDDVARAYRGLLTDIARSEEVAHLRRQSHDVAAVVPDFHTTLKMTSYWGVLFSPPDAEAPLLQHGLDPGTVPELPFERLDLTVPFSHSLVACLPKG